MKARRSYVVGDVVSDIVEWVEVRFGDELMSLTSIAQRVVGSYAHDTAGGSARAATVTATAATESTDYAETTRNSSSPSDTIGLPRAGNSFFHRRSGWAVVASRADVTKKRFVR